MTTHERLIAAAALKHNGPMNQMLMVAEECGELLTALSQYHRGRISAEEVITEIADVSIMIDQMAILFGLDDFKGERIKKYMRLEERIRKAEEEKAPF